MMEPENKGLEQLEMSLSGVEANLRIYDDQGYDLYFEIDMIHHHFLTIEL